MEERARFFHSTNEQHHCSIYRAGVHSECGGNLQSSTRAVSSNACTRRSLRAGLEYGTGCGLLQLPVNCAVVGNRQMTKCRAARSQQRVTG